MNHVSQDEQLYQTIERALLFFFGETFTIHALRGKLIENIDNWHREAVEEATNTSLDSIPQDFPFGPDLYEKLIRQFPAVVRIFPRFMNDVTLIWLVASFEVFWVHCVRAILEQRRDLIQERFKGHKDALASQIRSLKPIDKKVEFMKEWEDKSIIDLTNPDYQEIPLQEAHYKRHLLIHRSGIVDGKYLKDLQKLGRESELVIGDKMLITDHDLEEAARAIIHAAIHLFFQFGENFCGGAWQQRLQRAEQP